MNDVDINRRISRDNKYGCLVANKHNSKPLLPNWVRWCFAQVRLSSFLWVAANRVMGMLQVISMTDRLSELNRVEVI